MLFYCSPCRCRSHSPWVLTTLTFTLAIYLRCCSLDYFITVQIICLGVSRIVSTPFIISEFSKPSPKQISLFVRFLFIREIFHLYISIQSSYLKEPGALAGTQMGNVVIFSYITVRVIIYSSNYKLNYLW